MATNKQFWNAVALFSNKNSCSKDSITRKINNILIDNKENVAELFNKYFINTVQNTVREAPSCIGGPSNIKSDSCTVK